jgi:cytochrome P450
VIRDTKLPDGTVVPKGTHINVDLRDMFSADVYDKPQDFDPRRFVKRREAGVPASQFAQSSREHNSFGVGKHQCPGRFFAANELKLCLIHILLSYDIRIEKGYETKPLQYGFLPIVDPMARVEVRRR